MLFSLISRAITGLSAGASWLADSMGGPPLPSGNTLVTLRNPSTLTLALIGAGTIAIYLLASWRPSRTDIARWSGRFSDQSERGDAVDDAEQHQSRGAA